MWGGDGSGGRFTSDPRLRRCGWAMVAIRPVDDFDFQYLGHALGGVPGRQTTPRAEAMAILFTLLHTIGTATYFCDNQGVAEGFNKGDKYNPLTNCMLWDAIHKARCSRYQAGNGFLEVVWIESHQTYEQAMNAGYQHFGWIANSYADALASRASKERELPSEYIQEINSNTELSI